MDGKILGGRTCGTCFWREVVGPNGELECWHSPPEGSAVVFLTGDPKKPTPNHLATFTIRPPVKPSDRACSQHKSETLGFAG